MKKATDEAELESRAFPETRKVGRRQNETGEAERENGGQKTEEAPQTHKDDRAVE